LDAIINEVRALDVDARDVGLDLRCSQALANRLEQYRRFQDFGIADARGEVRCIALPGAYEDRKKEDPKKVNFFDRPWFKEAVANPKGYSIGEFQVGRITGCPTVTLAHVIPKGSESWVAWGSLHLSWLPDNESPNPVNVKCDGRPSRPGDNKRDPG
jgi:hypothetical protein